MVLWYIAVLLRKIWRYFPVFPLFCTLAFILDAKLFPWTAMWSLLGFHWCHGIGSGHCLSLLSEKPHGDFISLRMITVLLTLLLLLYSSLSYLPIWLFSGFHLPFLILSPFLQQPIGKVMCIEQQHTLLEKKKRKVLVTLENTCCAFPGGGYNLCMLKLEVLEISFILVHVISYFSSYGHWSPWAWDQGQ